MSLTVTQSYRAGSNGFTVVYLGITVFLALLFQTALKGIGFLIGAGLGAVISLIVMVYRSFNQPGIFSHYINYRCLPKILAGNHKEAVMEENVAWREREYSLSPYLPYFYFEDNFIFMKDGAVCFCLKLVPIYDETLTELDLELIKDSLVTMLNSLDMGLDLQFIFKKDKDMESLKTEHLNLNTSNSPLVDMLFKNRVDKITDDLKDGKLFNYRLYLFGRKKYNNKIKDLNILTSSPKDYREKMNTIVNVSVEEMKDLQDKITMYLRNVGLDPKIPTENEVVDLVASSINQGSVRGVKFDGPNDLIIDDFQKDPKFKYLYINNRYFGVITLKKEPSFVNITIVKELIRSKLEELDYEYDIVVNIRKLNSSFERKKLELKRNLVPTQDKYGNRKNEGVKAHANYSAQIDRIIEGESIFNTEYFIVIKADTEEELDAYRRKMLVAINKMSEAVGYVERSANFKLYLSCLPGNMTFRNYRSMKFSSSYISDLLPIFGPPASVTEPLMLFRNDYKSITYLNPFSSKFDGRSGLIIGKAGSGKSFLMNLILLSYFTKDPAMVIVEIGNSFGKMVQTMGGEYRAVTLNNPINLFGFNNNGDDDTIILYKTMLEAMVAESGQNLINDEKIIIEEAITEVISKKIETPCLNDFICVVEALDKSKSAPEVRKLQNKIIRYLKRWETGVYAGFFKTENNFNATAKVIGFDLKEIEKYPDLLELFMVYASSIVWHQVATYEYKVSIFDEAWRTLRSEAGGALMEKLVRTGRKEGAATFLISQAIKDIAESKNATAIMENIHFSYLLAQAQGADYAALQRLLNLSDRDIELIASLKTEKGMYSKIFVRTPMSKFQAYLIPGAYEYWMATTDYDDRLEFQKAIKENNNMVEVLHSLAGKYPHGVVNANQ